MKLNRDINSVALQFWTLFAIVVSFVFSLHACHIEIAVSRSWNFVSFVKQKLSSPFTLSTCDQCIIWSNKPRETTTSMYNDCIMSEYYRLSRFAWPSFPQFPWDPPSLHIGFAWTSWVEPRHGQASFVLLGKCFTFTPTTHIRYFRWPAATTQTIMARFSRLKTMKVRRKFSMHEEYD